jgi:DNA-binding transcriptional ArsR family regulator
MNQTPEILWDKGSAYDLFVSLLILHNPEEYGLRPSWAAGVRSRLPIQLRDTLDLAQKFLNVPLHFIHQLPEPKDALTVLQKLGELPTEEILPALTFTSRTTKEILDFQDFLLSLDGKQRLTAGIETTIKTRFQNSPRLTKAYTRALFEGWSNRKAFGESYLEALDAYVKNFYQEEEPRIVPAQDIALEEIQALASKKDLVALLEDLSEGVRMDWLKDLTKVVLGPSFWAAPFLIFDTLDDQTGIILIGKRPKGMSLVPGELVPEELLNSLKALSDPTRLRILHYLLEGPCTTSKLSKILRLRPPTVIHHLHNLRLAGLIQVTISPQAERQYAIRREGINATILKLNDYLPGD